MESAPLVDVYQASLEHRSPLGQVVLGQDQLGTRSVELGGKPSDLAFDLVHDPLSGFALALEVAELVVHIVYLSLKPLPLTLQAVPLGADFL
jgi:hypothetical protein